MKLRKLHIEDYKMFKDFDISFVDENDEALPIIVLAGVNGSGKTTLLEFINEDFHQLTDEYDAYIEYEFISGCIESTDKPEKKTGRAEAKGFDRKNRIVYFGSGIDDTKKVADEFVKTFYFYLKEKDYRSSEITEHFHNYMKDIFDDLDIGFKYSHLDKDDNVWFSNSKDKEYYYTAKKNNNIKDRTLFTIDELSTGEKTLLSKILYLYFKDYKEKVILIDEPELSLHPSWQNKVLKIYENFAKQNNCQIIIATHSPHIIGSAKNEYLRFLIKEDNKILVKELTNSPLDRDVNTIVKTLMGADYISSELELLRNEYRNFFDKELEDTEEAKELEQKILNWESPNSSFWQGIAFDKELRSI